MGERMKFGSVCSGIEAASVAWHSLGWKAAWFSEIEPFPCAVLKHHYPAVPNLGDMTSLPAMIRSGKVEAPDLFCGGTPCQAFSVAGLRRSLNDARGNLSLTFVGIANAIDSVRSVRGLDQSIIFWENVPGVLSTKDNAFGCFLGALAGEDDALVPPGGRWANAGCVYGPQRAVAWRILDAQYFGVAQRRRRVFVVASARADFDPAAVLFEFEGVRRDIAPRREAGQSPTGTLTARTKGGGGLGDFDLDGGLVPEVANPLTARMSKGVNTTCDEGQTMIPHAYLPEIVPQAMSAKWSKGSSGPAGDEVANLVAHSFRAEGFDASEDGTGRGIPLVTAFSAQDNGRDATADLAPTMRAQRDRYTGGNLAVAFHPTQDPISSAEVCHSIGANENATAAVMQPIPFDTTQITSKANGSNPQSGDPCHPIAAGAHAPAIAQVMQVRRLTPVECERLQGFPDNYTAIPWRKKPADECPDGPRYKALGNSWAVPVVRWIGERIVRSA